METGRIQKTELNLNYEMKKFSGSIKNGYTDNENSSKIEKEDSSFKVMIKSFKIDISSNTYENINSQGRFLERLGIGKAPESSSSSPFGSSSTIFSPKSGTKDDMFGEDGYWGIKKTAGRISDFVLSGAGDDIEKLKAGREGIQRGLKEAEKVWGGRLPEISYKTIEKSIEAVDEKINKLGAKVVDVTA